LDSLRGWSRRRVTVSRMLRSKKSKDGGLANYQHKAPVATAVTSSVKSLKVQKKERSNMYIGNITKQDDQVALKFYDEDLNLLEDESFADIFSLNFYLQTLPRKYSMTRTLLIIHNKRLNRIDMQIAINENSYYIT
jgi:hypothetical protein